MSEERVVDLTIESIAAGGDGVGRADGLVVFVPRSAPGDRGRSAITPAGRLARGRWLAIDEPGPDRVDPPCRHYVNDRCGGCQLQHLRYDAQVDAKARIISDAVTRIGRRPEIAAPVEPSPVQWRYRRKLTLALRRAAGGRWLMGLHPWDAPGRVFDLRDCPITEQRILDVWEAIRAAERWLPETPRLRAAVRAMDDDPAAGASLVVEGGERWAHHRQFFDAVPALAALWWAPERGRRRMLHTRDPGGRAGASFIQVNAVMARRLQAHVVERALAHSPAAAVDAYAGGGDTAAALAAHGIAVVAIELDPAGAARTSARLLEPSRAIAGRVEDALAGALPADVVVLNPPRAGVHERVTTILADAAASVRAVIYVSCNPATLARDLARLPGYRIGSLLGFDMFPQTAHVETVCELLPGAA